MERFESRYAPVWWVLMSFVVLGVPRSTAQERGSSGTKLKLTLSTMATVNAPYQPVRLRLDIQNISEDIVWDLGEDLAPRLLDLNSSVSHPLLGAVVVREFPWIIVCSVPARRTTIRQNDTFSVSAAIAAEWQDRSEWLPHGKAIFPMPGVHMIECPAPLAGSLFPPLSPPLEIQVPEPGEVDAAVASILRQDPDVADAIMSCVNEPDDLTVRALKYICEAAPSSSYVPCARFALARALLRGVGHYQSRTRDYWRESVSGFISGERPGTEALNEVLAEAYFGTTHVRGERKRMIERLVASRDESKEAMDAAIEEFVNLLFVSPDERKAGIRELETIQDIDFAYRPNVLIALRSVYEDPWRIKSVTRILDKEYADALEWRVRQPLPRQPQRSVPLPRR